MILPCEQTPEAVNVGLHDILEDDQKRHLANIGSVTCDPWCRNRQHLDFRVSSTWECVSSRINWGDDRFGPKIHKQEQIRLICLRTTEFGIIWVKNGCNTKSFGKLTCSDLYSVRNKVKFTLQQAGFIASASGIFRVTRKNESHFVSF